MRKYLIEWRELTREKLIEMEVLESNWQVLPSRLIVILKQEYKEDLFNYAYELLLENNGYEYTTFFNACSLIEMISGRVLKNERGLNEWNPKQYWHYLYRKKLKKEYLFVGEKIKNKRNKKRWLREMAQIFYFERLDEKKNEYF